MTEEENIVNMPKIGTVVMSTCINKCLYAQFKEKKDNNVEMERERERGGKSGKKHAEIIIIKIYPNDGYKRKRTEPNSTELNGNQQKVHGFL